MSKLAIHVEGIGKDYQIGAKQTASYVSIRDTIMDALTAPFRRAVRLIRGEATGAAELTETLSALQNINMDIMHGEVIGIIGRNGAGKSTLLKILSKITEPTRGFADIQGKIGTLLEVGTGFHPELTGRENVYLNGAILGMKKSEIDQKFDEIVSFAEVEKFIDTPVKHYSTGMSVRLAFAVAAHLEPDILMVDEVLAVGDVSFQRKCLGAMGELGRNGRTVLLVSHNMAAIENFCSRVIWIEEGKVRADGKASQVIEEYLATYSNNHMENTNLLEIRNRQGSGAIRFREIQVNNGKTQENGLVRSGDELHVRLKFVVNQRTLNPHFGVEVFSELGTKVTTLHTWMNGYDIPYLEKGEGFIDLKIDFLNLMPGRYYLTLRAESVGPIHYDVLDRCLALNVEASNYYQSGRGINSRFGLVFLPCQWELKATQQEKVLN
jgi:homopolymeric O-antigen transport system ATP-binding protein